MLDRISNLKFGKLFSFVFFFVIILSDINVNKPTVSANNQGTSFVVAKFGPHRSNELPITITNDAIDVSNISESTLHSDCFNVKIQETQILDIDVTLTDGTKFTDVLRTHDWVSVYSKKKHLVQKSSETTLCVCGAKCWKIV